MNSYYEQIRDSVSQLDYGRVAGVILIFAVLASIAYLIYFLSGWGKKPSCTKPTCGSTDVEQVDCPAEGLIFNRHWRCRMCSHKWADGPTIITT